MKNYTFKIVFDGCHHVQVVKQFDSIKNALFWAGLCLDICGKDKNGKYYTNASLFQDENKIADWSDYALHSVKNPHALAYELHHHLHG